MANRRSKFPAIAIAGVAVTVIVAAPAPLAHMPTYEPTSSVPDGRAYRGVVHLDQGWSEEDRLQYYFASQGSAAISYDIFLNLEAAGDQGLFRANQNLSRYGLVPYPGDAKYNPDGLPIGVTRTVVGDGRWKGEWVGLGCASCHNGQLQYRGTRISISGGNATGLDILAFIAGLDDALSETVADPQKFDRLSRRLGIRDDTARQALRGRLQADAAAIHDYRNRTSLPPTVVGPGRMDALSLIHNQVLSRQLGIPENWVAPLAPAEALLRLEHSAVGLGAVVRSIEGSDSCAIRAKCWVCSAGWT